MTEHNLDKAESNPAGSLLAYLAAIGQSQCLETLQDGYNVREGLGDAVLSHRPSKPLEECTAMSAHPDWSCWDQTFIRTARKVHVCRECDGEIRIGERYAEYMGESAGYQSGHRYHLGACANKQLGVPREARLCDGCLDILESGQSCVRCEAKKRP